MEAEVVWGSFMEKLITQQAGPISLNREKWKVQIGNRYKH
jgi:hypothetical protein